MGFGNLGIWEMLILAVIVLVFFGPRRLPEIARSTGKAIREFKRGMNEIQRELEAADRETRSATSWRPPERPEGEARPPAEASAESGPGGAGPEGAESGPGSAERGPPGPAATPEGTAPEPEGERA